MGHNLANDVFPTQNIKHSKYSIDQFPYPKTLKAKHKTAQTRTFFHLSVDKI